MTKELLRRVTNETRRGRYDAAARLVLDSFTDAERRELDRGLDASLARLAERYGAASA